MNSTLGKEKKITVKGLVKGAGPFFMALKTHFPKQHTSNKVLYGKPYEPIVLIGACYYSIILPP